MQELIKFQHSQAVRLNSKPYIVLRLNGSSYISKKAASLLNLKHGDTISFHSTADRVHWYIMNDPDDGATVLSNGGMLKFSCTPVIRKIFRACGVKGNKAFFQTSDRLQEMGENKMLYVIPNPFNTEEDPIKPQE